MTVVTITEARNKATENLEKLEQRMSNLRRENPHPFALWQPAVQAMYRQCEEARRNLHFLRDFLEDLGA